jgi:PBSX family phage portal protein
MNSNTALSSEVKEASERIKPVLKFRVIKAENTTERAAAKALGDDPFASMYGRNQIIEPPFSMFTLSTMPESCAELGPSLDAMAVNIERLGYRCSARQNTHDPNDKTPDDVLDQVAEATNFFENAVLDQEIGTLDELRSRLRRDLETTGNAYIEVIPNTIDPNKPAGLNHIPSWTMRLRKQDDELTRYEVPRPVRDRNNTWTMKFFPTSKRFRRFVQIRENGLDAVYFKEWGDPRSISSITGDVVDTVDEDNRAHEIIHLKLYCSRSPYGLPRWIGHLFSIFGVRAAEEINYVTFDNNQIPAMALLATNVAVTDGSVDRMQEFIETRVQGNKNYATILLIEAEPIGEGMKDPGSMKLELKPLNEHQHTDALFQNYIEMNNDQIRRAFRLPPIFVGRAEDYNRAVAEASRKLAEEQIFGPERDVVDHMFTNTIIARLGLAAVVFHSNKPNVTDNYELTQLLATAERSGGLTPRTSTRIVEDVTNMELPEPPAEINPDIPFSITMARETAKASIAAISTNDSKPDADMSSMVMDVLSRNESEGILTNNEKITLLSYLSNAAK